MATFLARLGRFAFKRRGPVVLVWLAILAGTIFAGLTAASGPDDDFSVPGIESQTAFDLLTLVPAVLGFVPDRVNRFPD